MPRKTKLNDEVIKEIVSCIELGMSYSATAGAVGVTPESFNNWLNWGKSGEKDPIFCKFLAAVREAESRLMYDCLLKLRKSAETGNIESVKWLLERRFGEFSKQSAINVKSQSENINVNVSPELTRSETDKIRADILSKLAPKSSLKLIEGSQEGEL